MFIAVCFASAKVQAQNMDKIDIKVTEKLEDISKFISLNDMQRRVIKEEYRGFLLLSDSALHKVQDANLASQIRYDATKKFHETFMSILTEVQKVTYVNVVCTPEIKEKTKYRLSLLREGGNYTEQQLENMGKDIFKYLMLEKIVYVKNKYDYKSQKNNISRLKAIQPTSLKESLNIEKQKGLGKLRAGNIAW